MADFWANDPVANSGGNWWEADPVSNAQASPVADFLKSIPRGVIGNLASAASFPAESPAPPPDALLASEADKMAALDKNFGLHQPQTAAGQYGQALGGVVGNPASYLGPGSLALKATGAALSGLGSEFGRQTAGGTPFEIPAQLAGGLAGGIAAGKLIGPRAPEAAIPTAQELKSAAKSGFRQSAESDLKIAPSGLYTVAGNVEQQLIREGFDPEGKVFGILKDVRATPTSPDQFVSSQSFDILNRRLQRISKETQMGRAGPEPTENAAAASIALQHFRDYGQNIPARDVMGGSAEAYKNALGQANKDYAAYKRLQGADARINKAENAADRQVAGSPANQIRSKVGGMLDNPRALRGLSQDEINQINLINGGNWWSNILRQYGRGGAAHVIPTMGHVALAAKTGGASLPLWASMVGARLADNAITRARAQELADMLAKRSALYESRLNALPPVDLAPNTAAAFRGLLSGL